LFAVQGHSVHGGKRVVLQSQISFWIRSLEFLEEFLDDFHVDVEVHGIAIDIFIDSFGA
jgi:hypothetical protein